MDKSLKEQVDNRVKLLRHIVISEMARGGGISMNGEMLLVFEALQELYEKLPSK